MEYNGKWGTHELGGTSLASVGVNGGSGSDCLLGWQPEGILGLPTVSTSEVMGGEMHLYIYVYVTMIIYMFMGF